MVAVPNLDLLVVEIHIAAKKELYKIEKDITGINKDSVVLLNRYVC